MVLVPHAGPISFHDVGVAVVLPPQQAFYFHKLIGPGWRARFLALAICRSFRDRVDVVTPYHCWNGFFVRGQFIATLPKQIHNATTNTASD
jgi:hypothetical protein